MTQVIPDPKYTKSYATIERASRAGAAAIDKVNHGNDHMMRLPRFVVVPTTDGAPEKPLKYSPVFFGGDPALLCHVMQLGYMVVN